MNHERSPHQAKIDTFEKQIYRNFPKANKKIVNAVIAAGRENFVPEKYRQYALKDEIILLKAELTIEKSTVSKPSVVVLMTQALGVEDGQNILEIGTALGFQAAVLSQLNPNGSIDTVESDEGLANSASEKLQGYANVAVYQGDGGKGIPGKKYDRIIVTAMASAVPRNLEEQLALGGEMIVPIGTYSRENHEFSGTLWRVRRTPENELKRYKLPLSGEVYFVPFITSEHGGWKQTAPGIFVPSHSRRII